MASSRPMEARAFFVAAEAGRSETTRRPSGERRSVANEPGSSPPIRQEARPCVVTAAAGRREASGPLSGAGTSLATEPGPTTRLPKIDRPCVVAAAAGGHEGPSRSFSALGRRDVAGVPVEWMPRGISQALRRASARATIESFGGGACRGGEPGPNSQQPEGGASDPRRRPSGPTQKIPPNLWAVGYRVGAIQGQCL